MPASEIGTGVPVGAAVGTGVSVAVADALGEGLAVGEAVADALALAEALALDDGEGDGDGLGDGDGDGLGDGDGDGVGVAAGEGLGDGVCPTGVGVAARSSPMRSWPRPVASTCTVVTLPIAEIELVRIWCTSVSGADDPQPATSGATTNNPPKTTKIGVRRNTKILLRLGRSETL
jgi:hypothetical protein